MQNTNYIPQLMGKGDIDFGVDPIGISIGIGVDVGIGVTPVVGFLPNFHGYMIGTKQRTD